MDLALKVSTFPRTGIPQTVHCGDPRSVQNPGYRGQQEVDVTRRQEDALAADRLWAEYARTHDPRTRERLIHQFERLAYSLANRFLNCGAEAEDLFQVALLGLVKAVDRFDPGTRHRFSTFATPTIIGELRRYFRDYMCSVHVSRGTRELARQVSRVTQQMAEELLRAPTGSELAARLNVSEERVSDVLQLPNVDHPLSLDGELATDGERSSPVVDSLGREDHALASAAVRVSVAEAFAHLTVPLREIMSMRYVEGLSQRETARCKGFSQMRVSRMERRALDLLRTYLAVH